MCTRRRQEFCGSAALWPSTRPKPTVSGEITCSRSSPVGPHRLTWTFARVLCQGQEAKKAAASIDSFWGGATHGQERRNKAVRRRTESTGAQTANDSSLPRPSCLPTTDNEMHSGEVFQTMALLSPLRQRCGQSKVAAAPIYRQKQSQQERLLWEFDSQCERLFE